MLIVSCLLISLLSLCNPISYCQARLLSHQHFQHSKQGHVSSVVEKIAQSLEMGNTSKRELIANSENPNEEEKEKLGNGGSLEKMNNGGKFSGGFLGKNSLVTVSWRVPSKNPGNKNPSERHTGIYSDYSQPRTRPPSHN